MQGDASEKLPQFASPTVEVMAPDKVRGKLKKTQSYYYKDSERVLQGPFYPGQMRGWLRGAFFDGSLECGLSLHGEVPTEFFTLNSLFEKPLSIHAFVPGPGIPNLPPEMEEAKKNERDQSREKLVEDLSNFKAAGKLLYYGQC